MLSASAVTRFGNLGIHVYVVEEGTDAIVEQHLAIEEIDGGLHRRFTAELFVERRFRGVHSFGSRCQGGALYAAQPSVVNRSVQLLRTQAGPALSFIVQAGSAPGLADLATLPVSEGSAVTGSCLSRGGKV